MILQSAQIAIKITGGVQNERLRLICAFRRGNIHRFYWGDRKFGRMVPDFEKSGDKVHVSIFVHAK